MYQYFPYFIQFPFLNSGLIPFEPIEPQNQTVLAQEGVENSSTKEPQKVEDNNPCLPLSRNDLAVKGYEVTKRPWTQEQDGKLRDYIDNKGLSWQEVAKLIPERNQKMCYSRYRRLQIDAKFHWTQSDNQKILDLVQRYGTCWRVIGLYFTKRTPKQIREHYLNHLRPNLTKKDWTIQEDELILQLVQKEGNKWKKFEKMFSGRTENQIKNRYYGRLKKMIQRKISKRKSRN